RHQRRVPERLSETTTNLLSDVSSATSRQRPVAVPLSEDTCVTQRYSAINGSFLFLRIVRFGSANRFLDPKGQIVEGRVLRSGVRASSTPGKRSDTPSPSPVTPRPDGPAEVAFEAENSEEEDDAEFSDASFLEQTVVAPQEAAGKAFTSLAPLEGSEVSVLAFQHKMLESFAKQAETLTKELRLSREREVALQCTLEALQEGIRSLTALHSSAQSGGQGSARTKRSRQQRNRAKKASQQLQQQQPQQQQQQQQQHQQQRQQQQQQRQQQQQQRQQQQQQ
uniref:Uncharacterized protein n=1 Tax=Anopheles funestus TaxID=62324 RepID=A0A182RZZ1_ANOFN